MTHAEIASAVRKLSYLKTPDRVRAGVRNTYGISVPVERVARILGMVQSEGRVKSVPAPLPSDAFDYDVRVPANSRPHFAEPVKPRLVSTPSQKKPQAVEAPRVSKVTPLVKAKNIRKRRKIEPQPRVYIPNEYVRGLVAKVCDRLELEPATFYSPARFKEYVHARALVAKLLQERNPSIYTTPFIASCIGRNDHTTVLWALKQFDIYCRVNPDLAAAYQEMRA